MIQVDIDPAALGRRVPLDLAIEADVDAFAAAIMPAIPAGRDREFLQAALAHSAKARKGLDGLATPRAAGKPLHPQYVPRVVDRVAADGAIFSANVDTPVVWAARYIAMNGQRRLIGSFSHGSTANALSQALGAQAAFPGRHAVSPC